MQLIDTTMNRSQMQ